MATGAIITLICMYMAYRKKEKILAQAKIASETVHRGSVALQRRLSLSSSQLSASIKRHSIRVKHAMITGSKNRTAPTDEATNNSINEREESSSSSDFDKR